MGPKATGMNDFIDNTNVRYKELDGKVLAFQGDFRPRTRYLYFLYCHAAARFEWTISAAYLGVSTVAPWYHSDLHMSNQFLSSQITCPHM